MRIYNGTNSQVSLPYVGNQRINIAPKSVSGNIGCNSDLLSLIVTSYTTDELAIIVSGPYELSMSSQNPVAVGYVVQTLDEAIMRFAKGEKPAVEEPKVIEEVKEEPKPVYEAPKAETTEVNPEEPKPVVKEEVKEEPKRRPGRPRKTEKKDE